MGDLNGLSIKIIEGWKGSSEWSSETFKEGWSGSSKRVVGNVQRRLERVINHRNGMSETFKEGWNGTLETHVSKKAGTGRKRSKKAGTGQPLELIVRNVQQRRLKRSSETFKEGWNGSSAGVVGNVQRRLVEWAVSTGCWLERIVGRVGRQKRSSETFFKKEN
jgi:hypothetical protein